MNERTIGIGIIGAGGIADVHARAIAAEPGMRLDAVHSRTAALGEQFARDNDCLFEPSLEEMLTRDGIDVVAITTPSGTHAELGIASARSGKHVLCEKPLDITTNRIDELIQVCDSCGVQLGAIFPARFGPGVRAAKHAIEEGRLGQLSFCSASVAWYRSREYYSSSTWRGTRELDGGGALMNQGIHAVDLLLYLAGDVAEVSARCQTLHHDIETEDNVVAWLKFVHGGLGTIHASTVCFPGEAKRIELKGIAGSITLVDDAPVLWQFEKVRPEDAEIRRLALSPASAAGANHPAAIGVDGHRKQYRDFVDAIQGGFKPAISGGEGRRSVALIESMYYASERNCVINLKARDMGGA